MDVASNEGAYTDHDPDTRCFNGFERGGWASAQVARLHSKICPTTGQGDVSDFLLGIWKVLQHILREVPLSFWALIQLILRRLRRFRERADRGQESLPCLPIPSGVWLKPDAYLYSQGYLMSLGMAVIWDNPDVQLTDTGGAVVGSHDLLPSGGGGSVPVSVCSSMTRSESALLVGSDRYARTAAP